MRKPKRGLEGWIKSQPKHEPTPADEFVARIALQINPQVTLYKPSKQTK